MATGDFLDLATRGCYAAQRDPGKTYDLARAKELVNECIFSTIGTDDPWEFTLYEGQFTTVANADKYTYSALATAMSLGGIREVLSLVDDTSGGTILPSMSWRAMEEKTYSSQDDPTSNRPVAWSQWNQTIRIYPTPSVAYSMGIMLRLYQPELSADTDTPLIPLEWRAKLIVPYVAAGLLRQDGGGEAMAAATHHDRLYNEAFLALRSAYGTTSAPRFSVVDPAFSDDLPGSFAYDYDFLA